MKSIVLTMAAKLHAFALLLASLSALSAAVEAPAEPMSVWFTSPANSYHESCPLGNGRLGAMDFGGVDECRVVLNESSVWSGGPYDANRPDAHQSLDAVCKGIFSGDIEAASNFLSANFKHRDRVSGWGDENQFGCYQILGDLTLHFNAPGNRPGVTSPSGHARGDSVGAAMEARYDGVAASPSANSAGNSIRSSFDGTEQTKWCVPDAGNAVTWQAELPAAQKISSDSLTSANDMPVRDPKEWSLEASNDGKQWTALDKQVMPEPFPNRFEKKSFELAKPGEYRIYRFTFIPRDAYFQLSEKIHHHRRPGMDRDALQRDFGSQVLFHGGVDNQHILPFGSVDDVRKETRICLETLGSDGGYICCSCHNVQAGTPVENILAMIETVRQSST